MSETATLTLAAILTLTARFHAGVEAQKAGDSARAAAELTAVIQADPGLPDLAAAARLVRGQVLRAEKKTDAALEDFQWLATRDVVPDLRTKAREEFVATGGKTESLAPALPPLAEWKRLQEAIHGGRAGRVREWMAGPMRLLLDTLTDMMVGFEPEELASMFDEEDAILLGQATDEAAGTARLSFRQDGMDIRVDWVQEGARWLIRRLRIEESVNGAPPMVMVDGDIVAAGDEWSDPLPPGVRRVKDAASDAAAPTPSPVLKLEIERCITDLGHKDAAVRAAARTRLREIGAPARASLKARADDPDPEIATTVRELLKAQ